MPDVPELPRNLRLLIGLVVATRAKNHAEAARMLDTDIRDAATRDGPGFVMAAAHLIGVLTDEIGEIRGEDPDEVLRRIALLSLEDEAGG